MEKLLSKLPSSICVRKTDFSKNQRKVLKSGHVSDLPQNSRDQNTEVNEQLPKNQESKENEDTEPADDYFHMGDTAGKNYF